jgi:hypothetical protein
MKQSLHRPEVSSRLRFPDFKTIVTRRWQGCQPYAPANFTTQEIFLVFMRLQDYSEAGRIMSMKNSVDTIGDRNRDPQACSAVP